MRTGCRMMQRVPMAGPRQVLLVEDEPLLAGFVTELLEELGYAAVGAATASLALDFARKHIGKIDLAIVDLGLPDRPGEELVGELRTLRPDLPIVVATGYDAAATGARFAKIEKLAVVSKPYTSEQLEAAIASLALA